MLCPDGEDAEIWVYNTGLVPLIIDSGNFNTDKHFEKIQPQIPDTIQPNDSVMFYIRFFPFDPGTYYDTLKLYNNDSNSANNPWLIALSGTLDSIGFSIQGVNGDTLDFGIVPCGGEKTSNLHRQ